VEKYWCAGVRTKIWHRVEKYWHTGTHAKIWCRAKKYRQAGARTKFSIMWCGLSDAFVILARSVHTHNKVCAVCTHTIMACMVCTVIAKRRGILLLHVQCGYMFLRDSLVNGAHGVLVCGGGILKFGMVRHVE
jgi:hypothetical protein